mmetsp:Transcript_131542/g.227862  ORF Transcript_131542/g.227862 Transcript_131542/m.227862 type:complete len:223 (-) Transcript_131542:747-1415(-)
MGILQWALGLDLPPVPPLQLFVRTAGQVPPATWPMRRSRRPQPPSQCGPPHRRQQRRGRPKGAAPFPPLLICKTSLGILTSSASRPSTACTLQARRSRCSGGRILERTWCHTSGRTPSETLDKCTGEWLATAIRTRPLVLLLIPVSRKVLSDPALAAAADDCLTPLSMGAQAPAMASQLLSRSTQRSKGKFPATYIHLWSMVCQRHTPWVRGATLPDPKQGQ